MRVAIEYLLSAFVVFTLVMFALNASSLHIIKTIESSKDEILSHKAVNFIDRILYSKGTPEDWDLRWFLYGEEPKLVGFYGDEEVSSRKILAFVDYAQQYPGKVYEMFKKVYGVKGFRIVMRPALNVTVSFSEVDDSLIAEIKAILMNTNEPAANARVDYTIYRAYGTSGDNVVFDLEEKTGSVYTDEYGVAYINITSLYEGSPEGIVEEYLVFVTVNYHGIKGIGYGVSGGDLFVADQYLDHYLDYEITFNGQTYNITLIYMGKKGGAPTNATVHLYGTVLVKASNELSEYEIQFENNGSRILNAGAKSSFTIILNTTEAPVLFIIPVRVVEPGAGSGGSAYLLEPYFIYPFATTDEKYPVGFIDIKYGVGEANTVIDYAFRVVDVSGVTYLVGVYVSR